MLTLLALAVAPGVAIATYVYSRDKYDREPLKPLLISFLLGAVATVPAMVIESMLKPVLIFTVSNFSIWYNLLLAFVVIAFIEEGIKFTILRYYAYRHKAFNEPFDGIIYSVMISMGFATLENIGYVLNYGFETGLVRMFLSVPSHAAFAVLMGYQVGVAKFDGSKATKDMVKGFLLAVFFHGAFDFFLLLKDSAQMKQYVWSSSLLIGSLVAYGIAIRMSLKSIRLQEALSKQNFLEKNKSVTEITEV
jgi:RsiW-degrading membrane proteinase PrsW (M82 family)